MKTQVIITLFAISFLNLSAFSQYLKPAEGVYIPETPPPSLNYDAIFRAEENAKRASISAAQDCRNQFKEYYKSITNYKPVIDGSHKVYAFDNEVLCDVRTVYTQEGKIVKYFNGNGEAIPVVMSGIIQNAKTLISIQFDNNSSALIEIYFFDCF